ncbi:MAG: hypothetical protein AAF682_31585 [Planctomycetota bacterium]
MSAQTIRRLAACSLLVFAVTPLALAQHARQACDNKTVAYPVPGGTVTGQGTTADNAVYDSAIDALQWANLSVTGCDDCPDGDPCGAVQSFDWKGTQVSDPVFDAEIGLWVVTRSFTGCTVEQRCELCD